LNIIYQIINNKVLI